MFSSVYLYNAFLRTVSGGSIGEAMLHDPRIHLISFTGSTAVGRHVASVMSQRFGKTILELGYITAICSGAKFLNIVCLIAKYVWLA